MFDLAFLVEPISEAEFFADYWEKKPLHASGLSPSRFGELLTKESFDEILNRGNLRYPAVRVYDADGRAPKSSYLCSWSLGQKTIDDRIDKTSLRAEIDRGATLFVRSMQRHSVTMAQLSNALENRLGFNTDIHAFYNGSAGANRRAHFDTNSGIICQIDGAKRWRLWAPIAPFPLNSLPRDATMVDVASLASEPALDVILRPGDMLFVPRGWVHEVSPLNEPSLHVTISIEVMAWVDLFRLLLEEVVCEIEEDAAFRVGLRHGGAEAQLSALRDKALSRLRVNATADRAFAAATEKLASSQASPMRNLEQQPTRPNPDSVVVRAPGAFSLRARGGHLSLTVLGSEILLPLNHLDGVAFIGTRRRFRVAEIPALTSQQQIELVTQLLDAGAATMHLPR